MPHWLVLTMFICGIAGIVAAIALEIVLWVITFRHKQEPDPFDPIRPYLDAKYEETRFIISGYRSLIPRIFFNKYDRYMHLPYVDLLVFMARLGYLGIIPAVLGYILIKLAS